MHPALPQQGASARGHGGLEGQAQVLEGRAEGLGVDLDAGSPAPRFPGTPNCGMMAAERRTDGKAEVRKRAWSILFQA